MGMQRKIFLALILLAVLSLFSCSFFEKEEPESEPTEVPPAEYPLEELLLEGAGDSEIRIGPGALSEETEIEIDDLGEGSSFVEASPLSAASDEYYLDLGGATQIGEITMTVPLSGAGKVSAPTGQDRVYLAWTEPVGGYPSAVGVIVENGLATFPVVGAGKYQIFSLKSHAALLEMISIFDPLAVPTYPQMTPAWCSPTAITNLAQFHQGAWPAGGLGSVWGETSNWYVAGKAGQAHEEGRFFHQVIGAGGYSVPQDVKESFSNQAAEVIIWNWVALVDSGFSNPAFANILFNSFQAYVEHFLWGDRGARRPVAFGSSLAAHSRTITGSDGEIFYMNNPSSGSLNETKSWEDYHQEIINSLTAEKIEVVDTVVFFSEPRPATERRGVIWLLPRNDQGFPGSVAMIAGNTGLPVTTWHWDGAPPHIFGYYHQDLLTNLPTDPFIDTQFKALHYTDRVEFGFAVQNIASRSYDFSVIVELFNEDMSASRIVGDTDTTVPAGARRNFFPADSFSILNLSEGLYTLKFTLFQEGIFQDAKYVHFRIKDTDLSTFDPHGVLKVPAFCRLGPGIDYPEELIVDENVAVLLVGRNAAGTWGQIEYQVEEKKIHCWIAYSLLDLSREDEVPIVPDPPKPEKTPIFSCSIYNNKTDCEADTRCEWPPTAGPGFCVNK